ncbi:hypothetical protein [Rhodopila sp.]|uniref:hypothetical protein n=1 Tax=Rhodopila sp. TaxID=2480087 RepID=UPI003D09E171
MNPLLDAEKVDIRRFCGYPAYGAAPTGMQSWRYFQVYGVLEFRLTNLSTSEVVIVRRYLGTLTALEAAVPGASDNLDTDAASMWTRNKNELNDRMRLFDEWRRRLCGFLGVPTGPALSSGTASLIV